MSQPYPLSLSRALAAFPPIDPDDDEQVFQVARDRLPLLDDAARDYLVRCELEKVFTAASRDTVAAGLATYGETADEVVFDEQRIGEAQAYLAARIAHYLEAGSPGGERVNVPADVAALVRAGHLEEVEPGVFRRPRLPSRADLQGTSDLPPATHPEGTCP